MEAGDKASLCSLLQTLGGGGCGGGGSQALLAQGKQGTQGVTRSALK